MPVVARIGRRVQFWQSGPARPSLFLDRDGVIIADTGYVGDPNKVALLPGVADLIKRANEANIPVIVVSNQSAVGRKWFDWSNVAAVDEAIERDLKSSGGTLDLVLYCGVAPNDSHEVTAFRKPSPGMLSLASRILPVDFKNSILVGDNLRDLVAAASAGLKAGVAIGSEGDKGGLGQINVDYPSFSASIKPDAAAAVAAALERLEIAVQGEAR